MNAKQWRDYLTEFPKDDYGDGEPIKDILTDFAAIEDKLRAEVEQEKNKVIGWNRLANEIHSALGIELGPAIELPAKIMTQHKAAEAREAALVACLRKARDEFYWILHAVNGYRDEISIAVKQRANRAFAAIDALLAAQPRQEDRAENGGKEKKT